MATNKNGIIIQPGDPDFSDSNYKEGWGNQVGPKTAKAQRIVEDSAFEDFKDVGRKYAIPETAESSGINFNKFGQATGSNTLYTDPMWFSPLHTPQSWQIASRRREIYQWCNTPDTPILMADNVGLKPINEVLPGDYVISHTGKKRKVLKTGRRFIDDCIYKIYYAGIFEPLKLTGNHKVLCAKRNRVEELAAVRNSRKGLLGLHQYKEHLDESVDWLETENAEVGDLLFTPQIKRKIKIENDEFEWTKGKCELLGIFAAEGDFCWYRYKGQKRPNGVRLTISSKEENFKNTICRLFKEEFDIDVRMYESKNSNVLSIHAFSVAVAPFFHKHIGAGCYNKRISKQLKQLPDEYISAFLKGYISGDGSINKYDGHLAIVTASQKLAEDLTYLFMCLDIPFSYRNEKARSQYSDKIHYSINVQPDPCKKLGIYKFSSIKESEIDNVYTKNPNRIYKTWFQKEVNGVKNTTRRIRKIEVIPYKGYVYNLEVEEDHSYVANFVSISNCRFYYENECKIAAGIDFYSQFPINGIKLRWEHGKYEKKLLKFWYAEVKRLNLMTRLKQIASEYFMIGDVFIDTDITCPKCGMQNAVNPLTGKMCNHPGGDISRIIILNPDWIEVTASPFADEPQIVMIPDEQIARIVMTRQPYEIYSRIPDALKSLIIAQKPIPLSNRVVSHLKHMAVPYGTYGTSMIRRCFTTLAYKTKIMTANWIVAERLIIPIRVVKIGSDNRPATSADISEVQQLLGVTANNPNMTIVTHHNFDYDWIGACHDEATEVLTNNGFKKYYEVDENDKIACLYIQNDKNVYTQSKNRIKFMKPLKRHVYDYDGEMVCFNNGTYLDICVTPNHRMLTFNRNRKSTVKRADEVKTGDRFLPIAPYYQKQGNDDLYIQPLGHYVPTEEFVKFLGYYLSEGYVTYNEQKYQYWCSLSQCAEKNKEYYEEIKSSLSNIKVSFHEYGKKNTTVKAFSICNKEYARWMKDEFGKNSRSKKIPRWIKDLHPKYLEQLLRTLVNGDGSVQKFQSCEWSNYNTISEQLADDIQEIAYRCGYNAQKIHRADRWTVSWTNGNNGKMPRLKDKNLSRQHYKGKVWCFTVPTGFFVTRRNGKMTIQGNSGKILQLSQELEHVDKELLDGLMLNQALLNGEMSGYQSAQVGVEVLIRRLEAFRTILSEWIEERVFKPIAQMKGLLDKEASKKLGEKVWLYPEVKWNDLNLKDNTQRNQLLMQLHDKEVVSTQTLCEEFDLNYDQEVERRRYEMSQAGAQGAQLGGGMGDMGSGMGGMGAPGGGAAPPPPMGGDMGGDMGGGMPGGDMGGGMGAPGGGAPMAGAQPMKVLKKGKAKAQEEQEEPMQYGQVKFTSIEQEFRKMLDGINQSLHLNTPYFFQYQVPNPNSGQPFKIDFAFPKLKLGIELDGQIWHSNPQQVQHDRERDRLLAMRGWTVVRFDDKTMEDSPRAVQEVTSSYLKKALSKGQTKKASIDGDDGEASYFTIYAEKLINIYKDDIPEDLKENVFE